jgi:hypothetical protein
MFGCASQTTAPVVPAPAPQAAPATAVTPGTLSMTTPGNVATLYIYRPKAFLGMALRPTVMVDGRDLANITNGRYYKGVFAPGRYLFQMDDKKSGATLDLVAGETYYFKVEIVPGLWKGGGKMTLMTKEQGNYEITQLSPIEPYEVLDKQFQ